MGEVKYYIKFPLLILISYIFIVIFGLLNIVSLIIDYEYRNSFNITIAVIYMLMVSCGLCLVIAANFGNKCYFTINDEGISLHEFKFYNKNITWVSKIYYMITDSFFTMYLYKNMILLEKEIINEKNIKNGYISIKIEKSLKTKRDNKGWICIPTRLLKNNIQINDIVDKINEYRRKKV
jgi:hypothetical protein